jgi:dienelactone hydrolase
LSRSHLSFCWLVLLAAAIPSSANGQVYDYTTGTRGTRMWVPPGISTVKGIVVYGNGAGADYRDAVYAPWLQQFAQVHDFALIGTSLWGNLSGTEINTWDVHVAGLAAASGHAELKNAPLAPMGFSNGGQMSYGFNALRPEKTIAFITNKGCCYNNLLPSTAALKTPGILIAGELDTATRRDNIRNLFETNRARGALWSWVEQPGVGHTFDGLADEIVLPFMAEAIRLRYPAGQLPTATSGVTLLPVNESDGWLTDQSTWKSGLTQIAAYDQYPGNKQTAGWLLNENVAFVYRAFSTYYRDVSLDFAEPLQYPGPAEWQVNVGFDPPTSVKLDIDLSQTPGWTKVVLFNYAQLVLQVTPGTVPESFLTLDVPILHRGVYGFSALVTRADGVTIRTSNLLEYSAIPEPTTIDALMIGAIVLSCSLARRKSSCVLYSK